jgi:serine/threonine-protein kinase
MRTPDHSSPGLDEGPYSRAATAPVTGAWSGTIPPPEDDDDLVGTILCNTYVIERVLGEGGMGRVYQARHTRIQRKAFAIKTLHPEFLRRPEIVKRFQLEAEAAAAIKSPHVIGVYDVDRTDDGRPFMVSELLDGRELGELIEERGKLPIGPAVAIVRQVCEALKAAHDNGVVHRDMKPENVFVTGDLDAPHVKVLDFGISRLDDGESEGGLTKTGSIMGTPAYMPPEQARGERVDHRADVYAVGAILYRVLTGHAPFEREDPSTTLLAVLTQEPARPRLLDPRLPEHLEAVIQRAMAREPERRFASMTELRDALELYDAAAAPAQRSELADQAQQAREARPLFVVLAVAALFALVAGLLTSATSLLHAARGTGPTAVELAVGALVVGAAASTPIVLLARHVVRAAWSNTVRMKELSDALRRALVAGVAVYGSGWLVCATLDHVLLGRGTWLGWDALLFVLALTLAVFVARARSTAARRFFASPLQTIALATAVALPVLGLALLLRDGSAHDERARAAEEGEASASLEGSTGESGDGDLPRAADGAERTAPGKARSQASEEELQAAQTAGTLALRELSERHPKDARVVKALLLARAAEPDGLAEALELAERLHGLDPKALQDRRVATVVKLGVEGSADDRARALALMGSKMGTAGPDMLYDLTLTPAAAQAPARSLLDSEAVRKHASAAVLIAHDLRQAKSCQAKAALLERAAKDGDQRSALILRPLTVGTRSGCGFLNLRSCPAPCAAEAPRIKQALQAIQARG